MTVNMTQEQRAEFEETMKSIFDEWQEIPELKDQYFGHTATDQATWDRLVEEHKLYCCLFFFWGGGYFFLSNRAHFSKHLRFIFGSSLVNLFLSILKTHQNLLKWFHLTIWGAQTKDCQRSKSDSDSESGKKKKSKFFSESG